MLVRHVGEAARQTVRASTAYNPRRTLNDLILGADRASHYRHPSFCGDADVDTFEGCYRRGIIAPIFPRPLT